jgi:serine/threonine protein kinase
MSKTQANFNYKTWQIDRSPDANKKEYVFSKGFKTYRKVAIERYIGQGGFGEIFLCSEPEPYSFLPRSSKPEYFGDEKKFILKKFNAMDKTKCNDVIETLEYVRQYDHVNICKVLDAYYLENETNSNQVICYLYLLMPYYSYGDLSSFIKEQNGTMIDTQLVFSIFNQLLDAVKFLHSQQPRYVIHRDISPQNILIAHLTKTEISVVLADFDLSREIDDSDQINMTITGNPQYMAPEVMYVQGEYDRAVDIWSLGVVFYELLTLVPPLLTTSKDAKVPLSVIIKEENESQQQYILMRENMKVCLHYYSV